MTVITFRPDSPPYEILTGFLINGGVANNDDLCLDGGTQTRLARVRHDLPGPSTVTLVSMFWMKLGGGIMNGLHRFIQLYDQNGNLLASPLDKDDIAGGSNAWILEEQGCTVENVYYVIFGVTGGNEGCRLDECRIEYVEHNKGACNTKGRCSAPTSHCGQATIGNPLNVRNGEKYEDVVDLALTTPAGAMTLTRAFRQGLATTAGLTPRLGLGWMHNNHARVKLATGTPNTIQLYSEVGTEIHFTERGTNIFAGDPGSTSIINVNPLNSDTRYTLIAEDKSTYIFDVDGKLRSRSWPNSETWTYTYSGDKLTRVEDGYNARALQFVYINNPGQFNDGQLWRVGDQDTTNLNGTPNGRYVEYTYVPTRRDGIDFGTPPQPLLYSVRDVRGNLWTYDYYGQHAGQTQADQLNFLTERRAPQVDTTGDGTPDTAFVQEALTYTTSGGAIQSIRQNRGYVVGTDPDNTSTLALARSQFVFPAAPGDNTEERILLPDGTNRTTIHRFDGELYVGPQDPAGNFTREDVNWQYRPSLRTDANGNPTTLAWSNDGKNLLHVVDALNHRTQFTYGTDDTLRTSLDAQGRKTFYVYTNPTLPRQPTVLLVASDDGLDINGGMELETGWASVGTPQNNEPSQVRVDTGIYSHYVKTTSAGQGIASIPWNLVGGHFYFITARVYVVSGRALMQIPGVLIADPTPLTATVQGSWTTVYLTLPGSNLNNVTLQFVADQGAAEFYVDSVHIFDLSTALRWQEFSYDSKGRMTQESIRDPKTNTILQSMTRTYYGAGVAGSGLLQTETQLDLGGGNSITTTYTYDNAGRNVQVNKNTTFGNCTVTRTVYDTAGNVVATLCNYDPGTAAHPTTAAEAVALFNPALPDKNQVTTFTYDAWGRRIAQIVDAGASYARTTILVYDALNRVTRTIENYNVSFSPTNPYNVPRLAAGVFSDPFGHGAANDQNLVTDVAYNERGRVRFQMDPQGHVTLYGYDDAGRVIRLIQGASQPGYNNSYGPNGDPTLANYVPGSAADMDVITLNTYDPVGNLVKTSDALNHVTLFGYDALNRQVKVIRSASQPNYNVSADRSLASYVEDTIHPDVDLIQRTDYNDIGQVRRTCDSLGNWTLYGYDAAGQQVRVVRNASTPTYDTTVDPALASYTPVTDADLDIVTDTVYDGAGRTVYTLDSQGERTWYAYDGLNRVAKTVVNAVGTATDGGANDPRSSSYVPNSAADRDLISLTAYNASAQLQWTQDALGRKTWHVYDSRGRETKVIVNCTYTVGTPAPEDDTYVGSPDADKDRITRSIYDAQGRVGKIIDSRGNETHYEYDLLGRQTKSITNYVDGVFNAALPDEDLIATTSYDVLGRVLKQVDAAGHETRYEYDALGRQTKSITNYVDGVFNAALPDEDLIATTSYDKSGQVVTSVDVRGTQTTFGYDNSGRTLSVTRAAGTPLTSTSYACYDKAGRTQRSIQNWINDPNQPSPDARDGAGNWLFAPDTHGLLNDQNLITTFTFDKLGRRTVVSDPLGHTATVIYRKDGQRLSATDAAYMTSLFSYDRLGRRTMIVQSINGLIEDPANWVWSSVNNRWENSLGQPIVHVGLGGANEEFNVPLQASYDKGGRLTSVRDARGGLTQYSYDQLDRRTGLINPLSHLWATLFSDVSGGKTRVTLTNPLSQQTQQDFDKLGRLQQVTYLNETPTKQTPDVIFGYDALGNRTRMDETLTGGTSFVRKTSYTYDKTNRLTAVAFDTNGDGSVDQTVSYQYDAGGRRTRLTLPGGLNVTYTYDTRGRLVSLTDWANQTSRHAYDTVGRLRQTERDNRFRSQYVYDAAGRLEQVRHTAEGKLLGQFGYETDARGNRVRTIEAVPSAETGTTAWNYTYAAIDYYHGTWAWNAGFAESPNHSAALRVGLVGDAITLTMGEGPDHSIYDVYVDGTLYQSIDGYAAQPGTRVTTITLLDDGLHTLDVRNRPEKDTRSTGFTLRFQSVETNRKYQLHTIQYQYDGLARVTGVLYYPELNDASVIPYRTLGYTYDRAGNRTLVNDSGVTLTAYTYDLANRLQTQQVNNNPATPFTYDDAGRMTNDGANTLTWDRAGRLSSYAGTTYQYNGEGQRVSQTVSGTTTSYLLDTQSELTRVLAATTNGLTTRVVYGPRGEVAQQQNADGSWRWLVADGLGSVRAVRDASLNPLESREYDPYGSLFTATGSSQTVFGFTGEETDSNGLVYLRARYLHPATGTFLSLDPFEGEMERLMSRNGYGYAEGDPVNHADPSGQFILPFLMAGLGAAAGAGIAAWMYDQAASGDCGCPLKDWADHTDRNRFILEAALLGGATAAFGGAVTTAASLGGTIGGIAKGISLAGAMFGAITGAQGIGETLGGILGSGQVSWCDLLKLVLGAGAVGFGIGSVFGGGVPGVLPGGGFIPAGPGLIGAAAPSVVVSVGANPAAASTSAWLSSLAIISGGGGGGGGRRKVRQVPPEEQEYLYRGDSRSPDQIKAAGGFSPEKEGATGAPEEIVGHANPYTEGASPEWGKQHYGKYVSTSSDPESAAPFGAPRLGQGTKGYLYKFLNPGGGYDVTDAFKMLNLRIPATNVNELEVAFGSRISFGQILEYRIVDIDGIPISDWLPIPK